MIFFKLLVVTISSLSLVACATPDYRFNTHIPQADHSQAYNLAKSAGFKNVEDIELTEAQYMTLNSQQDFSKSNTGAYVSAGALAYSSSIFSSLDVTMLGLGTLVSLMKPDKAETSNWVFGWVDGPDDPLAYMTKVTSGALDSASVSISSDLQISPNLGPNPFVKAHNYSSNAVVIPTSEKPKCLNENYDNNCFFALGYYTVPADIYGETFTGIIRTEPDLKNDVLDQFIFRISISDVITTRGLFFDTLEMYLDMSKALPENTYIYLAPNKYMYKAEDGVHYMGRAPMVLDQGKMLFFAIKDS